MFRSTNLSRSQGIFLTLFNLALAVSLSPSFEAKGPPSISRGTRLPQIADGRMTTMTLVAAPVSAEAFSRFGWVVEPRGDSEKFDPSAEPRLEGFESSSGASTCSSPSASSSPSSLPRLYVMRLPATRGRKFADIARHDKVTQTVCCLSAGLPWLLAVAPAEVEAPRVSDLVAFRIPPRVAVTLKRGTWHAGPLFDAPGRAKEGHGGISERAAGRKSGDKEKLEEEDKGVDFLNLERSDTNLKDRTSFAFKEGGVLAEIEVLWPESEEADSVAM